MTKFIGEQFGNYRLIALLGSGGFADVYLGLHIRLGTHAAVKILKAHLSEDGTESFLQEARTVAHLEHPHIVRILDFDSRDGIPFLVMNYYPNGTLRSRYKKGQRVPLSEVVVFVKQAADALQYAHEQKLIHRDIKPENMLVGTQNEILLGDFGVAVVAHNSLSMSTQVASGTAPYMAPEQITGHARPASDQYALAITVYEWLCGERPFNGPSLPEIWAQQMMTPPPLLRTRVPDLSADVEHVVMIALAKDFKQRFATVKAFATALEAAAKQPSISSGTAVKPAPQPPVSRTIVTFPSSPVRPIQLPSVHREPTVAQPSTADGTRDTSKPYLPQITWSDAAPRQPEISPRADRARVGAPIVWSDDEADAEAEKPKKQSWKNMILPRLIQPD